MIHVQETVKTNSQDDSSMLQAWTAAHRSVFYTWKFYNELKPTQSTSCSGERRSCFPHHPQKYVPAPSSTLALKPHAASQIRKLIWQQPNPPKTREGSVFGIKVLIWFNTRHHKCRCQNRGDWNVSLQPVWEGGCNGRE